MKTKHIALILAILLIISSLAGCTSNSNEEQEITTTEPVSAKITDDTSFKLSYTQADSLDPFKATAQNNQVLASLVFESLFDINEAYEITPNIASEYEYEDSQTLRVDIKSGLTFSNGEALTSDDVVYSIEAALDSPAYGSLLEGISGASAGDGYVEIYLNYANPYAVNLLTFPITSLHNDDDGFPLGNGRYHYESSDGKTILKANVSESFNPYITTINLVNIAAADSIDNAINIGNISYAYRDLSTDISKRISSAKKLVNINNLVFIGLNGKSGITADAHIRQAISLAADRQTLADSAYSGYATIAVSPFNPSFADTNGVNLFSQNAELASAKQAILQSAYSSDKLDISILVYKNNEAKLAMATLLKSQLEAAGFTVSIDGQYYKDYLSKISYGQYDIYIGEVKLSDDMCLYPLLSESGNVSQNIDFDELTCDDLYEAYLSGDAELGKFMLAFNEEMPFVPILYRKGMICYTKAMNGDMQGYYGNLFSNIESWNFNS